MSGVIIFLLIVWIVLAVLGAVLEGLFWLTVVGLILLVGTAGWGWMKRSASGVDT
jgi:LPXTG-motif cell wall-anchored protein